MNRQSVALRYAIAVIFALGGACATLESQQPQGEANDQESVDSKAKKAPSASQVDFKAALGLPFSSLGTLGSRIDAARHAHDPVSLAHAANELAVAEKVSGKQATMTSSALLQESAQLAKLRRQAAELEAVSRVADQVSTEQEVVASLKKDIILARQQAEAETASLRRNAQPTDAPRKIVINNYTAQYVDIWVNGSEKTQVQPGQSTSFTLDHKWNPTTLTAYGNQDNSQWGPRYVWGRFKTYTWNLN
jgi:hypothetical protein